jgi:glycosyltransferase involved in cell wall biosynthesis
MASTSTPYRICVVTHGQIGSNPRVVKEAQALVDAGFSTTVIALRMLESIESRDDAVLARARWTVRRIDMRARWRWRVNRAFQIGAREIAYGLKARTLYDFGVGAATIALRRAALQTPADLYIAHYPAALPAAAAAARRYGGRYAYDAEDLQFEDWPSTDAFRKERASVRAVEAHWLRNAAYVSCASPIIADAYRDAYAINRPQVVWNVFPQSEGPSQATPCGTNPHGPSLYWFSQTIGPDRGLECAVRAIGAARTQPHLHMRGALVPGFRERLESLAVEIGAGGRLHFLAPDAPDAMPRLASAFDLGLAGETSSAPARDAAVSNKLFTYLLAGVPPLMSMTTGQSVFATEIGARDWLYPIDDARALAALIDKLLGDSAQLAAARSRAFRLARQRYNWECESKLFLGLVETALSRNS